MSQIPLLFLGDSPSMNSGLARIGRDLAVGASRLPQFRVAYLGRAAGDGSGAGIADARLPFMQYTFTPTAEDQWGATVLPDVWRNHANGERGVIFTIWDPSRLTWFGNPLPPATPGDAAHYGALNEFLTSGGFERWGYFAIDAEGPLAGGALAPILGAALRGYDRVLAYSRFGRRVIEATFDAMGDPHPDVQWLPHGINTSVFKPRDRAAARELLAAVPRIYTRFGGSLMTDPTAPLIGCVMTNQPRKDWGLWARSMRLVADQIPNVLLWAHTDSLTRHWDLRVLLDTFDLTGHTLVTTDSPSDEEMSYRYSACDLTVLPSLGEGFGYPIAESLACGVPAVHGAYAAGAELIDNRLAVQTLGTHMDGRYCMMRPDFEPSQWAQRVLMVLTDEEAESPSYKLWPTRRRVEHLEWRNLWPSWERWLVEGAARFESHSHDVSEV